MARRYYSSTAARTTLASGVDDTTTTLSVVAVSGWPASFPYTLVIDQDTINEELVEVTARSGTTLTVTRGVDGSTAVAHSAGAAVNHGVSARDFDEPNAFINGTDYVSTDGGSTVEASGAAVVPLTLKGASGQTANLLTVEDSAGTDLVVVDEAGNVGIGLTNPNYGLTVGGATGSHYIQVRCDADDSTLGFLFGSAAGTNPGAIFYDQTGDFMWLRTNGNERMRLNSNGSVLIGTTTTGSAGAGDVVVNGGVFLGGSAAANELDDYEEGTWTPTYAPATGAFGAITYWRQYATYRKIGNVVLISLQLGADDITVGTASGAALIEGLPFTSLSGGGLEAPAISIGYAANFGDDHPSTGIVAPNASYIVPRFRNAADGATLQLDVADLAASLSGTYNWIQASGFYFTA